MRPCGESGRVLPVTEDGRRLLVVLDQQGGQSPRIQRLTVPAF
jgi:hypothetical protein